jgi:uracil phosphoribosyltransferase
MQICPNKTSTATGGSAIRAIEVLLASGVPEERIIFLNLVASPEGVERVTRRFEHVRIISAWLDEGLNEKKYIVPGLGDFGDR